MQDLAAECRAIWVGRTRDSRHPRGLGAQRDGGLRRALSVAVDQPDISAGSRSRYREIQRHRSLPHARPWYFQL